MQENKERGQPEDNKSEERKGQAKGQKQGKEEQKKNKSRANTQKVFYPPNSTRAQKPHKPRKAPKPYKPTQQPQTALKTPLKSQIKAYFKPTHREQSSKETKGREHATKARKSGSSPTTCNQWTR